jgi:hypothetical protein
MSAGGVELDQSTVARACGDAYFNLLRRGADGSLTLSHDHWRLSETTPAMFRFSSREADAPPLELPRDTIQRVVWDRLPKQQVRSQIRFYLTNGDIWTFSGKVTESALSRSEPL